VQYVGFWLGAMLVLGGALVLCGATVLEQLPK
jgi:hypothetical protein